MSEPKAESQKEVVLILARCGEIAWHSEHRFAGRVDLVLTPNGISQAHKLAQTALEHKPVHVFSSPLIRAKQTVELIKEQGKGSYKPHIVYSEQLTARSFGVLQGLTYQDARRYFGEEKLKRWSAEETASGGEPLADVQKRVVEYYQSAIKTHTENNESVLILTHGSCLQVLTKHLKLPLPLGTTPGAILVYQKQGQTFKLQNP